VFGVYESEVAEPPDSVFMMPSWFHVVPLSVEYWKVTVPVGVTEMPVTVTEAVTDLPRAIGLTGTRVGAGTVGIAALTGWILTKAQIDSEIRNAIIRICSFFMFFFCYFLLTWIWGLIVY
jgi:hypothetical protein